MRFSIWRPKRSVRVGCRRLRPQRRRAYDYTIPDCARSAFVMLTVAEGVASAAAGMSGVATANDLGPQPPGRFCYDKRRSGWRRARFELAPSTGEGVLLKGIPSRPTGRMPDHDHPRKYSRFLTQVHRGATARCGGRSHSGRSYRRSRATALSVCANVSSMVTACASSLTSTLARTTLGS